MATAEGMDLSQSARLFESEATKDMLDRQVAVLRRLVRVFQHGYPLADLPQVRDLIELAVDKVTATDDTFVDPLIAVLQLACKPFVTVKASEDLKAGEALQQFLQTLSGLLFAPNARLQLAALEVLLSFSAANEDPDEHAPDEDMRPTIWSRNHSLIASSNILPDVVAAFGREVVELFAADTNADGVVSTSEYHRFKVTNDSNADNDDDEPEAEEESKSPGPRLGTPVSNQLAEDSLLGSAAPTPPPGAGEDGAAPEPSYFLSVMVRLMKELSEYGDNATAITRLGALQHCVTILSVVPFQEEIIAHCVETLWNALEHSFAVIGGSEVALSLTALLDKHRGANAAHVLGTDTAAVALTALLEQLLTRGYRLQDKEVRNDVVVVATLLARRVENRILLLQAGFLDLALLYGTAAEVQLPTDAGHRNFATTDAVDHQLKLLLWSFVGVMCGVTLTGDPKHGGQAGGVQGVHAGHKDACVASVRGSWFPHTLVAYLDPVQAHHNPYLQAWSPAQERALELAALRLLEPFAKLCAKELQEESGPQITLLFIRKHNSVLTVARPPEEEDDDDAHHEVLEDGDADPERVELALAVLRSMTDAMGFGGPLGDMGAVEDLMEIVASFDVATAAEPLAATSSKRLPTPLSTLELALTALARLCADSKDNQARFRRGAGVPLVVPWLRFPLESETSKPLVVGAAVALVWEAVARNYKNEVKFIAEDGMDALLDLLEAAPGYMRAQVLGCLADLTLNSATRPYVRVWKSDHNGRSVASYLLQYWMEEEDRREGAGAGAPSSPLNRTTVSTGGDPKPAFDRLRRALKAAKMWRQVEETSPGRTLVQRVQEADLRPKIFAILANTGFEYDAAEGTLADLTYKEQATLCLASRYADYRKGAAWRDVLDSLAKKGVLPVDADAKMADEEVGSADGIALEVEARQASLSEAQSTMEKETEDKAMSAVLAQKHTEEEAYRLATRRMGSGAMTLQEWLAAKSRLSSTRR